MNNVLYMGAVMGFGYAGYCVGTWVYENGKEYVKGYIMKKVMDELNKRLDDSNKNEEDISFKPTHSNSAIIRVSHGGKKETIYVPYDRRKSTSMLRKRVYLISYVGETNDIEKKEEITQKPGVPYLVSASHLGGSKIVVETPEGDLLKEFNKEEIPGYL